MNKRKRTAHRRAAMWGGADPTDAIDLDADMVPGRAGEVVFARGVVRDDGREMARLFPDRWEEMVNRHLDARRAGEISGAEPLTAALPSGAEGGAAVMHSARKRWEAMGLVPQVGGGVTQAMHYPMTDEWRQAAARILDDRDAADEARDDRAHAMLDLLTQDALRRRGIMATVERGTITARADGPTFGPLDFEEARAEALREMTIKREAAERGEARR